MSDRKAIGELLLQLEENYASHKPMSSGALSSMVDDLEDFSLDQVRFAIREHRRVSKWYPTIAELRLIAVNADGRTIQADLNTSWSILTEERHFVMDAFYAGEPVDFEALARKFDRADRPDGAAAIRRHVERPA